MIFVTVGTQLPFERLVAAMDAWAAAQSPRPDVLAQVGGGRSDYPHIRCVRTLDGSGYEKAIGEARLMVAHAGTGSILTALDRGIPVIIMPRDHRRGEHRDDHQMQTARQIEKMALASVVWSEVDLPKLIDDALARADNFGEVRQRGLELIGFLRAYVQGVLRQDP